MKHVYRSHKSILVLSWLGLLTAGCGALAQIAGQGDQTTELSKSAAATYSGPECSRALYALDELNGYDYSAKETTEDPSAESQILLAVCERKQKEGYNQRIIPQWPRIAAVSPEMTLLAADDRQLPVAQAAASAVLLSRRRMDERAGAPSRQSLAAARIWFEILPPESVEAGLVGIDVPADAKTAFLTLYRAEAQSLKSETFDGQVDLLVELPVRVFAERQEHFEKYADLYASLDALLVEAKAGGDAALGKLRALRQSFLQKCTVDTGSPRLGDVFGAPCTSFPLFGHATREIARLHVVAGHVAEAQAESYFLVQPTGWLASFAAEARFRQELELAVREARDRKIEEAKRRGLDEASARELGQSAEVPAGERRANHDLVEAETQLVNLAAALDGVGESLSPSQHEVASVKVQGKRATVTFVKTRSEYSEEYGCVKTNRVARIHTDGRLEYERKCKGSRKKTVVRDSHAPIELDAAEAVHLRSKDLLAFFSDKTKSVVVFVQREQRTMQVRGIVLSR